MNQKLELKHIAGYLPYGLKVEHIDYDYSDKVENKVVDVIFLAKDCIGFSDGADYYFHPEDMDDYNPSIKPLIRPMSDLYKPCLEDGKIPIVELAKIAGNHFTDYKISNITKPHSDIFICGVKWYDEGDECYYVFGWDDVNGFGFHNYDTKEILFVPHQIQLFEKLYQWHFDIHGLIEKNLALDMNTIR